MNRLTYFLILYGMPVSLGDLNRLAILSGVDTATMLRTLFGSYPNALKWMREAHRQQSENN